MEFRGADIVDFQFPHLGHFLALLYARASVNGLHRTALFAWRALARVLSLPDLQKCPVL